MARNTRDTYAYRKECIMADEKIEEHEEKAEEVVADVEAKVKEALGK